MIWYQDKDLVLGIFISVIIVGFFFNSVKLFLVCLYSIQSITSKKNISQALFNNLPLTHQYIITNYKANFFVIVQPSFELNWINIYS